MRVAVVILNWNGINHLQTFLPSVVQYSSLDTTVYIADNASTDASIQYVQKTYPQVKIVQNTSNSGFAQGYNEALKHIEAEYYVLLNSDVEVSENWISPIIEFMDNQPEVGICQPKILSYRNKEKFEYAGAAGGFIDFLGYPFCRGRIFQQTEKDEGQYNDESEIFWASGACMFIRSKLFNNLKGFDGNFFAHMEEIDLCWRAKNLGHKVYYIPTSTVYHLGGGTLDNSNPRKTFLNFRNSLATLYKNDHSPILLLKIFMRLSLDSLAFFKLMKDSGMTHAFSIVRAHFAFYGMKKQKSSINVRSVYGVYKGSIVLEHFLKGKSKFSQLKKPFSRALK